MALAGDIGPEAVRAHVERILATPEFGASPQLAAFLTYIVQRKLAGDAETIKAYTIATEALGRPPDFDPQTDPIVRVQARRLRQALLIYYANPQADDTIRISLPVGGYVPDIAAGNKSPAPQKSDSLVSPSPLSARAWPAIALAAALLFLAGAAVLGWPSLAVWIGLRSEADANPLGMPSLSVRVVSERQIPGWFSPELFQAAVSANLSRFDEFVIVESGSENKEAASASYRLDLEFTGVPSAVLMSARLVRQPGLEIVWSNRSTIAEDSIGSYQLLDASRKLASVLGQPYGVLYSQLLSDPQKTPSQRCLLDGYEYFQDQRPEIARATARCLERIIADSPGNHIAHVLLGYMYAEQFRAGQGGSELLDKVTAMAQRAVSLRPDSAGSQQILMESLTLRGLHAEALEAGGRAVQLNPNDSDVLADYGCALINRGRYSEGESYAQRAASLNVVPPPWHLFCLFVAANNTGRSEDADAVARRMSGELSAYAFVPIAIAAAREGDREKAQRAFDALVKIDPAFSSDPMKPLMSMGLAKDVARYLSDNLTGSGLALSP
jgi:tetratricopeptide (TPR) repeat protein